MTNWDDRSVRVLQNEGGGVFGRRMDRSTGSRPSGVAIGDVDGDGKPELAVTQRVHQPLQVTRPAAPSEPPISVTGRVQRYSGVAGAFFRQRPAGAAGNAIAAPLADLYSRR